MIASILQKTLQLVLIVCKANVNNKLIKWVFLCLDAQIYTLRVIEGQICSHVRVVPPCSHRPSVKSHHVLTRRHQRERKIQRKGNRRYTTITVRLFFVLFFMQAAILFTLRQYGAVLFDTCVNCTCLDKPPLTGIHANSLSSFSRWVSPRDAPVSNPSVGE